MFDHRSRVRAAAAVAGLALLGTSLVACSSGGGADGKLTISYLVQNDSISIATAEKFIAAFEKANPDITVKLDSQPPGSEGDNLTKTKLSTGEMSDVFSYNTGSLLQALEPDNQLVDLSDEAWVSDLNKDFVRVVSTDNGLYGAPVGTSFGGGVLYNKKVYEQLGLSVPTDWKQFMANSEQIQANAPEVTPVIQSYGDDWTAQIYVLADFANVAAQEPDWADDFTANKVKYADEPALAGFQHQQDSFDAGFFNKDYASMTLDQALTQLSTGAAAQFPMLTNQAGALYQNNPDTLDDIGFFALPADDAQYTSVTMWQPNALYIPKSTQGDKLEAAKKLVAFISSSKEGCAIQNDSGIASGPFSTSACEITGMVPPMIADLNAYVDAGKTAPALEFLSPVKGPNLPNLTIQVGSGLISAKDGASQYDEDVKKQAQQLGLEGW